MVSGRYPLSLKEPPLIAVFVYLPKKVTSSLPQANPNTLNPKQSEPLTSLRNNHADSTSLNLFFFTSPDTV
jgi:hypothetical protein